MSLDNLPNLLIQLNFYNNKISSLNNLPNSLKILFCDDTIKNYNKLIKKYYKS